MLKRMRNRWFHRPEFQTSQTQKRTSWLELFYDFIFVAAFIQLGNGLINDFSARSLTLFLIVFTALWFSWTGFTLFSNRFNIDDFLHRLMIFGQMVAIASMSAFAPRVMSGDPSGFSISYAAAQAIVALLYLRAWLQGRTGKFFSRYWFFVLALGATAWAISVFVPPPTTYFFWGAGLLVYIVARFSGRLRRMVEQQPYDFDHLSRRYGTLTIVVLGETFMRVLSAIRAPDSGASESLPLGQAAFAILIAFSIWWIYFDDIVTSPIRKRKFAFNFWLYGHIPLHGSIILLGVSVSQVLRLQGSGFGDSSYRWLLCSALAIAFLAVAVLDASTEREQAELGDRVRVNGRIISAVLLLLLAPSSRGMSPALFIALLAAICGVQVLFDLMIAPMEFTAVDDVTSTADLARQRLEGSASPSRARRPSVAGAIRKGTPSEFKRDLYFYFIQGSWTRFLLSIIALYLLANCFFAGLYMLEPGSIAGQRPDSFADAFYFSVQTISTIGYGVLNPKTDYANMIVVCEAAFGLAAVALVTGLMVAKASKPRAGIIFSKWMVITPMNGKPHLIFRTGNTRGNDVISAEITVSVLKDEISPEGVHIRRMHDLKLMRHRSPFFTLSWTVMHEIDESSPFHGVQKTEDIENRVLSIICILTGHDSTYGQTIFARHTYDPSDIQVNRKFVDVIGQTADGRIVIDYSKFHDLQS